MAPRLPHTTAHHNDTLQHPAMAPRPLHTAMAPGATSNPPKWFVALPPIGSKNPYSYHYLGKNDFLSVDFYNDILFIIFWTDMLE